MNLKRKIDEYLLEWKKNEQGLPRSAVRLS